jgi:7-cyano-7-deazaguanine synthase in queuosine biosynthesis
MKARGDEAVMLAAKTSRHNGKLAAMADLGKGNKLDMTTACNAAATKTKIIRHAAAVKKGKAPTAYDENQKDPAPHRKEGSCRSCRDQS